MIFNAHELYKKYLESLSCKIPRQTFLVITVEMLQEIYDYAAKGLYEKQIAMMLGVSDHTFMNHKKRHPVIADALRAGYKQFGLNLCEASMQKMKMGSFNALRESMRRFNKIRNPYNTEEDNEALEKEDNDKYKKSE